MAAKPAAKSGLPIFKIIRWGFLLALIVVIALMLMKPAMPVAVAPEELLAAAKSFDGKLMELEQANENGAAGTTIAITENELNGLLLRSAEKESSGAEDKPPQIAMSGDEITAHFVQQRYGKDIYVTIAAHIAAENGHLAVHLTGFKIGALPISATFADGYIQKKLNEPEMQEKTKLPAFISDLHVENGQLVLVKK